MQMKHSSMFISLHLFLLEKLLNLVIVNFRLFVLKMSWSVTLLLSLGMQMQRYTNVKMSGALDLCVTSKSASKAMMRCHGI